ncbi:hypothetical protein HMN09_01071600 [Mycena chlorophos]|uniref:Uncharacterized protein n=1 Tax=Mycena chlorophos TaxID=658473 RepID=A0A8H6SCX7_MYCCL|nr:hypothetical protein HMN09_01071600 [Mycena chlorophos]
MLSTSYQPVKMNHGKEVHIPSFTYSNYVELIAGVIIRPEKMRYERAVCIRHSRDLQSRAKAVLGGRTELQRRFAFAQAFTPLSRRNSIISVLPNGLCWQFYLVQKSGQPSAPFAYDYEATPLLDLVNERHALAIAKLVCASVSVLT